MTDLHDAVRRDAERWAEIRRKRELFRHQLDHGIEEGRAEEAEQDAEPPRAVSRFIVAGYKTNDENEEAERHETPWANVASSYLWGMLRRGYVQILVEGVGPDGKVAYGKEGGC